MHSHGLDWNYLTITGQIRQVLVARGGSAPCGKGTQDRFCIPARIPASYEPSGSRLSENKKIKKIYGGTHTSEFSKTSFFVDIYRVLTSTLYMTYLDHFVTFNTVIEILPSTFVQE